MTYIGGKFWVAAGVVLTFLSCCKQGAFDSKRSKDRVYMEHLVNVSGYLGPISEFNFSYARPVEFYTIGWIKVEKKDLSFRRMDALKNVRPTRANDKFYLYDGKVICPPRGDNYVNWSFDCKNGEIWMAYDLDAEFLWFVEEINTY